MSRGPAQVAPRLAERHGELSRWRSPAGSSPPPTGWDTAAGDIGLFFVLMTALIVASPSVWSAR